MDALFDIAEVRSENDEERGLSSFARSEQCPYSSQMPNSKLGFKAAIEIRGVNPYIAINATRAKRLKANWRKPMPVRIQIDGKPDSPWRVNLMPAGDGSFYLYLQGQVRRASNTKVGDVVSVTIEFDPAYKGGPADPMPTWFSKPLARNRAARRAWAELSPSRQKEIVRYLAKLKSPQAQKRNVERALEVLSGKKARYMARTWNDKEND
jgi:hypothetical protein